MQSLASELAAASTWPWDAFTAVWREHRNMAPDEQLRVFLDALDPALPTTLDPGALGRIARVYQEPAPTHRPEITPAAAEAVHEIRARGFRLGVISNTGRTPGSVLRRLLEDAGLLPCFDILAFSDEAGVPSQRPRCSCRVLDQAGMAPAGAVHVGDETVTHVAGARGVGMRAIHYVPDPSAPPAEADGILRRFADLPHLVSRLA